MKKLLLFLLFVLLASPTLVVANVDDDVWSYLFQLEYRQGTLAPAAGAAIPYRSIPMAYSESAPATTSDYYAVIYSFRGIEEARFGFNRPSTEVAVSGKGLLFVYAPYFADADHVSFFSRSGMKLFDISVKGSSFCNDNHICNADVGENHNNCAYDCPVPASLLPQPLPLDLVPTATDTTVTPLTSRPSPKIETSTPQEGMVTHTAAETQARVMLSPLVIVILVGSVGLLLILLVLWRIRKNMD